jgi:hypothetical protein
MRQGIDSKSGLAGGWEDWWTKSWLLTLMGFWIVLML